MRIDFSFRRSLLVASALGGVLVPVASLAQIETIPNPSAPAVTHNANPATTGPYNGNSPGTGTPASTETPNQTNLEPVQPAIQVERIRKVYQQLLQKEKDIPTSVTELGAKQVQQNGQVGTIQSLLTQAPSVNSYQQGVGQNSPELTIRGVNDSLLASSLDDVPIQSLLLGGTAGSFVGQASSFVTNDEIGGVNIYPGIAAPDNQGFNALGGTIAYDLKKPTADRNFELEGGVGSFNLSHAGFEANSGALGGPDGLRLFLHYDQSYNGGYQDYTPSRYRDMLFSADKPYDGGLSHLTMNVTYNTGFTYSTARNPAPVNLLNEFGSYWYYPHSETYNQLSNQFLFADVGDETYINSHLIASVKLFYEREADDNFEYQRASDISPLNPYPNPSSPFFFNDILNSGTLQGARSAGYLSYNPAVYGLTSFNLPSSNYFAQGIAAGIVPPGPYAINGQNAQDSTDLVQTFGIRPRLNIFLPYNNITIGGLAARSDDNGNATNTFVGPGTGFADTFGFNSEGASGTYPGGEHRTVLDVYAQDKIDVLHNTLHFQPGFTIQSAISSYDAEYDGSTGGGFSANVFNKAFLPYFGASYDITKHLNLYGSYGRYSLFAPLNTYSPDVNAQNQVIGNPAPNPENLTDYEGGIRYDSSKLLINVDYYYERATNLIGFFQNFSTGQTSHGNPGAEEFKGFELNGTWKITPDWSVFGTGSFTLAKYLSVPLSQQVIPGCQCYLATVTPQDGQFGLAFGDTPLSTVPVWLANFGFEYQHTHTFVPNDHVDVRVYGHYVGEQNITQDNAGYPGNPNPLTEGATETSPYKQPAFTVFNLLAQYDLPIHQGYLKDLSFALNVQNLFDLKYYQYEYLQIGTFGYGLYGGQQFKTAVPGIPVNVTFDVAAKF